MTEQENPESVSVFLQKQLYSLEHAKNTWFVLRIVLLVIAAATTSALGLLQPEALPLPSNIIGIIGFLSVSIYIVIEPEKRHIASKEAYLSLRSDIGKYNMAQISSEELLDRWSRTDDRLYSKILRC